MQASTNEDVLGIGQNKSKLSCVDHSGSIFWWVKPFTSR